MQRISSEMEAIRLVPTNLSKLVAAAVEMALSLPELDGCSIQLTDKGCSRKQRVVPDTITHMLINLLINAAEAKPGGMIEVRILPEDERLVIEVHDQGPGVPPDMVNQIFRPHFSTKKYHVGLGLLAVQAAVEIHGGCIAVSESHLGGACFQIQLAAK